MASFKDAGASAGSMLHGPGGLLGVPGLNKQIINAMICRGVAGASGVKRYTNEIFPISPASSLAPAGTD
jgi:hypothetical protein